jgi:peptide/nickel transport system substrate-binding protein
MLKKLAAAAVVTVAAALASPATMAATPQNMLVVGTNLTGIRTLDPAANNARTVSELICNLYDTLVQTSQDDLTSVKPMLATKWTVSDDKKVITLTMRDDATFASGNPVTADDAAWSIQRVIKLGQVGSADIALWGFKADNVDKLIHAVDAHTLEITLPQEVSPDLVLESLASASIGIIDKKVALSHEQNGDMGSGWLTGNAAGGGPFTLAEWHPNEIALFNARKDYWGGAPAMARVAVRHIPESGNLRLQLESGDVDIGQYVSSGDLEALQKNKDVTIQNVPGFGFYFIAMNMKDPDMQKPLVRQAFQHIFDWKAVTDNIMRYLGSPWQSVVPKGMLGAPSEAEATSRYGYDPALAKSLLAKAGYPDGLKKKLYPAGALQLPIAEALQSSAKAAGVNFELVPGEWTPAFRARDYDVMLANSGAKLPDPFSVATLMAYNPDNSDAAKLASYDMWRTGLQNTEINDLITQSGKESDPAKRAEFFKKIDQIYATMDSSILIFFQRSDPYVVRTNVKGYQGKSTWSTRWDAVTKG